MKRIIVFVLCLQITLLSAQSPYYPMLVEGRSWDIFQVPGEMSICPYAWAGNYFFEGDTLLSNGLTYKKLYFQNIRSNPPFPFCGGFYRDTTERYLYPTFFREDTVSRQVFMCDCSNSVQERLLFDFSLQAGDTLHYEFQSYPILEILDITLTNGGHRKALKIGDWWGQNMYVEGIGYLLGGFVPVYYPFEGWGEVTCVRDSSGTIYTSDVWGDPGCILATSGTQTPEYKAFELYPNPIQSVLTLHNISPQNHQNLLFELYDMTGRTVFHKELASGSPTYTLDLPRLPQGLYVWAINGKQQGKVFKR